MHEVSLARLYTLRICYLILVFGLGLMVGPIVLHHTPEYASAHGIQCSLFAGLCVTALLGLRYPVKAYQAQVSSTLTRGSRLDTAGLQDLASRGFHGVVNFCKEYDDSAAVTAAGMNPLHLSVLDNTAPTYDEIKQFLDFVTAPANQPAYCHCEAGVGRTGVFCASYRIAVSGFTTAQAIAEAAKYGLSLQSQIQFLQKLGPDILAGKIAGYPVSGGP